jgi:hypothetical protein
VVGGGDSIYHIPSYGAQDPAIEHTVHISSGSGTYKALAKFAAEGAKRIHPSWSKPREHRRKSPTDAKNHPKRPYRPRTSPGRKGRGGENIGRFLGRKKRFSEEVRCF